MTKKQTNVQPAPAGKPDLAPIQILIADEVADMLVHGGNPKITGMLISAAAHHQTWRWASDLHGADDLQAIARSVNELGPRTAEEWRADMLAVWKANRQAPAKEQVEPKTVVARIRACVLDELRTLFGNFLTHGTPEEHRLMVDVLLDHESGTRGRDSFDELVLGQALERALNGTAPEYVMVPSHLREQVGRYIECLKAAKDCKAA